MTMNITAVRTDGLSRRPRDALFNDALTQAEPFVRSPSKVVMDRAASQRISNSAMGRAIRDVVRARILPNEELREFDFTHKDEPYQLLFKSGRPHWLIFVLPDGDLGHYDFHSGQSSHVGDDAAIAGLLRSAYMQLIHGPGFD